jgi:uncharacterized DUF497 family protein
MFTWDPYKALANCEKHGVSFDEAATVFEDIDALALDDSSHSTVERRAFRIGRSHNGRILTVVYTTRRLHGSQSKAPQNTRLISARQASRKERRIYRATPSGR